MDLGDFGVLDSSDLTNKVLHKDAPKWIPSILIKTLFIGGPIHARWVPVCPWQRVHYQLRGNLLEGKYCRKNLTASDGSIVRFFAWQNLSGKDALVKLFGELDKSGLKGRY